MDEDSPVERINEFTVIVEWNIKQVTAVVKLINENRPPRPVWLSDQYPLTVE